ncbi:MAG: hypothetical protein RI988_144 [Pseudomonadota bacterium]|jgi:hypothetical protein
MLRAIRRWFSGRAAPAVQWPEVQAWCAQSRLAWEPLGDGQGFAVENPSGPLAWRLEWGRPERLYVRGRGEMRMQADLGLAPELHLMVLDGSLQQALERAVLDQIASDADSRFDPHMPLEMRWVVTFPRLALQQAITWPAGLEAFASHQEWLLGWVSGPLARALDAAPARGHSPLLLLIAEGRLQLRTGLDEPTVQRLQAWRTLFECAMHEARRVHREMGEPEDPSTVPSLWAMSPGVETTDDGREATPGHARPR